MAITQSFFSETYDTRFPNWCYERFPCDTQSITFSAHLNIKINDAKWKTKLLFIKNEFMLTKTKQNDLKWICYLNSTLKIVKNPREQTTTILLSQGPNIISIKGEIEDLLKTIKRYTIQEEFKSRFQLIKKLGQGAFAEVYSAKNKLSEDYFAVKMFEKSFLNSNLDRQSLLKEIKVLRTVYHEFTVSLIELYETQCYIYIVMELLKGGNLSSYLDKYAPLSEKQTAQIVYNLLISLNHINSFGIFHRDLKPDTVGNHQQRQIITIKMIKLKYYQQNFLSMQKKYLDNLRAHFFNEFKPF